MQVDFGLDQGWSILPALELLPSTVHAAAAFCLRREQLRGSNSNTGKMDQTWTNVGQQYSVHVTLDILSQATARAILPVIDRTWQILVLHWLLYPFIGYFAAVWVQTQTVHQCLWRRPGVKQLLNITTLKLEICCHRVTIVTSAFLLPHKRELWCQLMDM